MTRSNRGLVLATAVAGCCAALWAGCLLGVDYDKGPELPPAGGAGGAGGAEGGAAGASASGGQSTGGAAGAGG